VVLIVVSSAPAGRAVPLPVDVRGDTVLGAGAFEEVLGDVGPDGAGLKAAVDSLLSLYVANARPFARIEAEIVSRAETSAILVVVREGEEARIGSVRFVGDTSVPEDELRRAAGLLPGRPLTPGALDAAARAVVDALGDAGRPLARVVPSAASAGGGHFDLSFDIDEGPPVVLGELVVVGTESTRDEVVRREAGLERGRPFARRDIEAARSRLERTGLFSAVREPTIVYAPATSEAVPVFELEEARVNRVLGALGYVPGDDRLSGAVEVALGNIAGTGRRAEVQWERLPGDERTASFSYVEPWIFGAPIDVGVAGEQTVRDTISTVTGGDLSVTSRLGERSRVSWSLGAERYVPGTGAESPTSSVRTALAAIFDATDSAWNPTRGVAMSASVEYAAKEVDDTGGRERSGTVGGTVSAFVPLSFRQTLALRASGAGVWSSESDVPFHEEIPLGGASTLRGYREAQFRGVRVVTASVEYRYLVGRASRVIAFVDAARFRRDGSNPATDTKLGYGIGLRGGTRFGIIAVDYGLGEGDSLLDGKLHVGFTRAF
jgi:outer membrane protein insertion porin family